MVVDHGCSVKELDLGSGCVVNVVVVMLLVVIVVVLFDVSPMLIV
jgi:hypothetical protein